jgi:hypothetical protein
VADREEATSEANSLEASSEAGLAPPMVGAGGNSPFDSDLKWSEIQIIETGCDANSLEVSSEAGLAPTGVVAASSAVIWNQVKFKLLKQAVSPIL